MKSSHAYERGSPEWKKARMRELQEQGFEYGDALSRVIYEQSFIRLERQDERKFREDVGPIDQDDLQDILR